MRIGKMHLYSRIALLVAIGSVAKCSAVLDGISQELETHREGKGISLEHGTHIEAKQISQVHEAHKEGKGISLEHETHRDGKRLNGQRTSLTPILQSILGIIDFDDANCTEGNMCLSYKECLSKNGTVGPRCAQGFGVCCTMEGGTTTPDEPYEGGDIVITEEGGFFFNPLSEETTAESANRQDVEDRVYNATITPPEDIIQVMIDIMVLDILEPMEGDCSNDSLTINGAIPGLETPVLCGKNTNQQLYIAFVDSVELILRVSNEPASRTWNITFKFLTAEEATKPLRCMQYHTATSGMIKSFNFEGNPPIALNNQMYTICFAYVAGYCPVGFTFSRLDLGRIGRPCGNDYLLIGDDKHCGDFVDYVAQGNETGPIYVNVRTDDNNDNLEEGFSASYAMMGC